MKRKVIWLQKVRLTSARKSIALVSIVARAGVTPLSVGTHCIVMTPIGTSCTFIQVCNRMNMWLLKMYDFWNYSSSPTITTSTLIQNTYNQLSFASPELNDQQFQLLQEQQVSTLPRNVYIYQKTKLIHKSSNMSTLRTTPTNYSWNSYNRTFQCSHLSLVADNILLQSLCMTQSYLSLQALLHYYWMKCVVRVLVHALTVFWHLVHL